VVVALNRVPPQGRLADQVASQLRGQGLTLLGASLGNRTGFASAFAAGLGVTEAAPRSLAAEEVRALAAALKALAPRR
jgi:chromosome partitioning protein